MRKVLVNAYAVSPERGSEPGMGWNWCVRLARECELFIITEGEFKDEIERALPSLPQGNNMHFYYLPVSDRTRRMCWNQGDWRFYFHYSRWQRRALKVARRICSDNDIDIIHQLNMVGFREPGYLWKIHGIPFVWGPIAGMTLTPARFFKDASVKERIMVRVKNVLNSFQRKYLPRVRKAIRRSRIVLCATKDDFKVVSGYHHGNAILVNETGTAVVTEPVKRDNDPVRLIWVGKFMFSKQLGLALNVLSRLMPYPIVLDVVGSGTPEEEEKYHSMAVSLGISDRITWHGQVPRKDVDVLMDQADIFMFTSIREATSTVVMEAITHGLPVVCFDICGFGPVVSDKMGIKIPVTTPEKAVGDFAEAIMEIADNPQLRSSMSAECYRVSPKLSWDAKTSMLMKVYEGIVSGISSD